MLRPTSDPDLLHTRPAPSHGGYYRPLALLGWICLIWFACVVSVCALGYYQIRKHFSQRPRKSSSSTSPQAPHVTVIRPVKGLEPHLYECLTATLRQDYPRNKLTVYFCISTKDDPAYPILLRLLVDLPRADAHIYVEEDDPVLQNSPSNTYKLGPNPKIRNMSRAYREAKGDIIWIIDCNVWVGRGACGRMVDKLCGYDPTSRRKYKFVHHLPIAVDVSDESLDGGEGKKLLGGGSFAWMLQYGGGHLEELFLSSSHAKMYTAINTVLIAPCIVGKSNMFRRSHLDFLTAPAANDPHSRNPGIDYFSDNICEDHLIGDLLWKGRVQEEIECPEGYGKHALVFGDLAIQPVSNMSVQAYFARRVRWQRVRKFTVFLATLVEPGTESILCSLYGAFGVTTSFAPFLQSHGYEAAASLTSWSAFAVFFVVSMVTWVVVDWTLYIKLHSAQTVELDEDTPSFARPKPSPAVTRRPFFAWFVAWVGRECLAFPIWFWAFYGGVTVVWRDRKFKVGLDMKVREVEPRLPISRSRPPDQKMSLLGRGFRSQNSSRSPSEGGNKVRRD